MTPHRPRITRRQSLQGLRAFGAAAALAGCTAVQEGGKSTAADPDPLPADLTRLRTVFVNVYYAGTPRSWVLIDAGLQGYADTIVDTAEGRFGRGATPRAIILTHGHFDHVGAFPELFDRWDVPVYAHAIELPHLTGRRDYPPPDPGVGKGAVALGSFGFPNRAIDLGARVRPLPADGGVPHMPGWRWVHTPGHTAGHVALFREADRCLVSGDAFVTVRQESLYAVARQEREVNGPPAYFTPDWPAARRSVERLAALRPAIAATGHGVPMSGPVLTAGLETLVRNFDDIAVPDQGRYVPPGR